MALQSLSCIAPSYTLFSILFSSKRHLVTFALLAPLYTTKPCRLVFEIRQESSSTSLALSLASTPIPTVSLMMQCFRLAVVFLPATSTAPNTSLKIEAFMLNMQLSPVEILALKFDFTEHWLMLTLVSLLPTAWTGWSVMSSSTVTRCIWISLLLNEKVFVCIALLPNCLNWEIVAPSREIGDFTFLNTTGGSSVMALKTGSSSTLQSPTMSISLFSNK